LAGVIDKPQTNVRLTTEGRELLDALAAHYGMSISAVVEMLVRRDAKVERVHPPKPKN
jgi:hypothetical protein